MIKLKISQCSIQGLFVTKILFDFSQNFFCFIRIHVMIEFAINHNIGAILTFLETILCSESNFSISRCFIKIHSKLFFHRLQHFHRAVLRTSRSRTAHYLVFNLWFFDRWNEFNNRLDVFLINIKSVCYLFLVTNRNTTKKILTISNRNLRSLLATLAKTLHSFL